MQGNYLIPTRAIKLLFNSLVVFIWNGWFVPVGGDGILSEAKWLLDTGLLPNSNSATRAIGYRQVHP